MGDRAARRVGALLGVAALALAAGACSSDPPDPAEVRRQQVEARLEATFSKKQASCIVDGLDEPTIAALVRTTALDSDSEAFRTYSNVVLLCTNADATTGATTTAATGD
ncbi:MAG: hypothetical protein R2701_07050 [Acidimicrobiales bacterium]|nr:hypothetical protein [Acidimicrobiales bacterium]